MNRLVNQPERIAPRVVVNRTDCDSCGNNVLAKSAWNATDITIEAKVGSYYPEADCRTYYKMDLCEKCFMEKLLPKLKEIGKVQEDYSQFYPGEFI